MEHYWKTFLDVATFRKLMPTWGKLYNLINILYFAASSSIPHGLMARILGFHPRGPGSIPGVGEHFLPPTFFHFHTNSVQPWKDIIQKKSKNLNPNQRNCLRKRSTVFDYRKQQYTISIKWLLVPGNSILYSIAYRL